MSRRMFMVGKNGLGMIGALMVNARGMKPDAFATAAAAAAPTSDVTHRLQRERSARLYLKALLTTLE